MSDAGAPPAPFLIVTALGDGTEAEIPVESYAGQRATLARMSRTCTANGAPTPATVVWRFDRGAPRPMCLAELEEGDLASLAILTG